MDVTFDMNDGTSFSMEVGYSDSVLEMKQKIHKHTGIPVSNQFLAFHGILLEDGGNALSCFIAHDPRIQLLVMDPYQGFPEPPKLCQILIRVPNSTSLLYLTIEIGDSVLQLKQRLHQTQGLPTDRLGLYLYGKIEMQDDKSLSEYWLSDGCVIDVFIKPPQPPSRSSVSKKRRIRVLTWCKMRLNLEVNLSDKVQVLRQELEKLQEMVKFELSPDGYFFIHKQSVMNESASFLWNNVRQGDLIEIFNGTVTYGNDTCVIVMR